MATMDCWTALGLNAANPGSFNDTETALDAAATAARTAWDIADIGYTLLMLDGTFIPVLGFISLAIDITSIIGMFSGRPQMEDTNNVIWAYNMSAYWPLHALAADLKIAAKNGAPISDSNPAIQSQFSAWKQGTIISIQQTAGWQGGPNDPGYWQLQRLINYSWSQSGGGQQAVLNVVRAIDRFTQILACLKQQQTTKPPPPPPGPGPYPPPPPPPGPTLCDSGNPNQDEILDFCTATQTALQQILSAIQALNVPGGGGGPDPCCLALVTAIGGVTAQLANITALLVGGDTGGPSVDLTPLVAELAKLGAAVAQYPPALAACCTAIAGGLNNITTAIKDNTGTDVSGIVSELKSANTLQDVPAVILETLQSIVPLDPAAFSLLQGSPYTTVDTVINWIAKHDPANVLSKAVFGWIHKHPVEVAQLKASVTSFIQTVFGGALSTFSVIFEPVVTALLNVHKQAISKLVLVKPGQETTTATELLTEAISAGVGAHFMAVIGELAYPTKNLGLPSLAALMAELAGFTEIMRGIIGVEVRQAVAIPHTYTINAQARALLPTMGQAMGMLARRKVNQITAENLLAYAGLSPDYVTPIEELAYRPLQPRTLVQAFLDQPINRANLVAMLQDTGMSDTNVQTMADAIIYKSDANVRNSYLSSLITAYGKGIISDQELSDALTQFNFSPQAKQYVISHVLVLRREALASEAEKTIVPLVANGNITPQQGLLNLEAAGIQPWYATLQIDLATTRATIHGIKLQAEAARKLALEREREAQRAAVEQFEVGNLNAAGLSAALLLAGIDPLIASMVVSVEVAKQQGRMQVAFNQLLPPLQAKVLREQVAAIEQQTKDQLITLAQAAAQLGALGLDQAEVDALVARWAAMLKKTPGAAVYQTP